MSGRPLAPYPSPAEREAELEAGARAVGGEVVAYGTSVRGRPLRAVRVPSTAPQAPRVLCTANLHGPELVGGRVAFGLLRALAEGEPVAGALRDRAEIWIAPCCNPDGYDATWARRGDGPLHELRPNARGVDLNRNFPLPQGASRSRIPTAGSSRPGRATYRGPHPLSEPETQALDALARTHGFHASANLHAFMGTIIPARVTDRESFTRYKLLCRAFAAGQRRVRYRRVSSRIFDVFTGELEDHLHHAHRVWAACIEVFPVLASLRQHLRAPSTFWRFNPRDPQPWVENDVPGVVAFLRAALDLPPPAGPRRALAD